MDMEPDSISLHLSQGRFMDMEPDSIGSLLLSEGDLQLEQQREHRTTELEQIKQKQQLQLQLHRATELERIKQQLQVHRTTKLEQLQLEELELIKQQLQQLQQHRTTKLEQLELIKQQLQLQELLQQLERQQREQQLELIEQQLQELERQRLQLELEPIELQPLELELELLLLQQQLELEPERELEPFQQHLPLKMLCAHTRKLAQFKSRFVCFPSKLTQFVGKLAQLIQNAHSAQLEQRRKKSSDERSKPESNGMVFKRNTLRKQHNSARDDPGELFPDLVELETVLEDCVMDLLQLVSFIIIYGLLDLEDLTVNDTNMDEKMLMISNQGCGEEHELSVVVGNTPIIVV